MNIPLKQYWDLLSRHIRPQKGRFIVLTILLVSGIGLQIANPEVLRSFIDAALGGAATNRLLVTGLAFMGIALLAQALSVGVTYLGESVAWTATNALRAELAWHCLELDMGFHNDHPPGELIERIDGDVAELSNFFSQLVITLIGNLLLIIGILIVLFFTEWRAGLVFMLFAILALYALFRVRDIAVPFQKARRQAEAELFGFIEEQLTGTEDIRSSAAESYSLRELYRLQAKIIKSDRKAQFKHWLIGNLMGGFIVAGNILAIAVGYFLYKNGSISVGTVYLFIFYMNLIEQPMWTLTHEVQSFQMIGACVARLADLRKVQPRIKDGAGKSLPEGPLPLVFEAVEFAYHSSPAVYEAASQVPAYEEPVMPEMPVVLRNLSFRLEEGKILGLLGRTGSGKTTLARLVFRLYDPTSGCIRLDSTDIRETRLESLRDRVALVTQDIQLFRASVRDNLTFFDNRIPDEQI
ncbi:MAG: ABC transporter ATP-binding protein, partial [Omnitrophica WOR_2 bacterium]